MRQLVGKAACLLTITLALSLAACGTRQEDDLAVAKMSQEELQATSFLPLNPDKPGTPVDVERYLVPGKYTIVVYFSPYWDGYVTAGAQLTQLVRARNDIVVRTVNINRPGIQEIDWQSPIVKDERISSLPFYRIYDPAQKLRAQGRPAYEQVMQWVRNPAG